jgi:hypothetical protein
MLKNPGDALVLIAVFLDKADRSRGTIQISLPVLEVPPLHRMKAPTNSPHLRGDFLVVNILYHFSPFGLLQRLSFWWFGVQH